MKLRGLSRFAVVGCLMLLLSACSSVKLAYTFADEAVEGRAEDYLDLSDDRGDTLRTQTRNMIAWHRVEMLPVYADFFNSWADHAAANTWSREDVDRLITGFRGLLDETVRGASPYVAAVLIEHKNSEQIAYLRARMDEKQAERIEEEAAEDRDEDIGERVERRADVMARFIGDLREDQMEIVREHVTRNHDGSDRWLVNRGLRQDALIALLETDPNREEIADFVYHILLKPWTIVDPDYEAVSNGRWDQIAEIYHAVLVTLDDEQRDTFVFNLRSFATDMAELASAN